MSLVAGEGLLAETFAHFRSCGRGRRECIVLWTGPVEQPRRVDRVVHPLHTASPHEYVVDRAWAVSFALESARERRTVRLQAHVHPVEAFHSTTDDAHSIISKPGFMSLVIPHGARGAVTLDDSYLAELQRDGSWLCIPTADGIRWDR